MSKFELEFTTMIWLGPTGSNNLLGYVETNKPVKVTSNKMKYFKEQGLIEEVKNKKSCKPVRSIQSDNHESQQSRMGIEEK